MQRSVPPVLRRLSRFVPEVCKRTLRPLARRLGLAAPAEWWQLDRGRRLGRLQSKGVASCNVCGWSGSAFLGGQHVESATCPQCGSVARDRFLLWCAAERGALRRNDRVLETSPRMGDEYREFMRRQLHYRASDFDLGAHRADLQIDLQAIALPDSSLDVVLTPHVLEHVPDTARALAELYRVMVRGGRVFLQVPLLHGVTAAPTTPEFHADNTPVFWNFGWDLIDMVRAAGFTATVLVTKDFSRVLSGRQSVPAPDGDIFDVADMVRHARPDDMTVIATDAQASSMGWLPSHQFVTWECRK
ncbi:MAG TPA: methyltransferase domain-containing protein [Ilumatobacteraceae bacterium]|nr:methyltransferase domain-containing protein [Ilumatobacteraceae bacterium]